MIIHDKAQTTVQRLSSAVNQMRRAQLEVEYVLQIALAQGVFNPANPYDVPDGVVIDSNTNCIQGTSYTWPEFAGALEALFGAAADLGAVHIADQVTTRETAINRLATQ